MATSEAKEIKKQETLVRFSIISYKTRLRVLVTKGNLLQNTSIMIERKIATEVKALNAPSPQFLDILPPLIHLVITEIFQIIVDH